MSWLWKSQEEKLSRAFQKCVQDQSTLPILKTLAENNAAIKQGLKTLSQEDPALLNDLLLVPGIINRLRVAGHNQELHQFIDVLPKEAFTPPVCLQGDPKNPETYIKQGTWSQIIEARVPL